jgi:hypothetical protein
MLLLSNVSLSYRGTGYVSLLLEGICLESLCELQATEQESDK